MIKNFIAASTCISNHTSNTKLFKVRRFYSTKTRIDLPIPILIINNLHDKQHVLSVTY